MIDYKHALIILARNAHKRHKMTADEGAIVGWATNESGEHYPIHEATGGGGSNPYSVHNKGTLERMMSSHKEKIDTTRRTLEKNTIRANSRFLAKLEPKKVKSWQAQERKSKERLEKLEKEYSQMEKAYKRAKPGF